MLSREAGVGVTLTESCSESCVYTRKFTEEKEFFFLIKEKRISNRHFLDENAVVIFKLLEHRSVFTYYTI